MLWYSVYDIETQLRSFCDKPSTFPLNKAFSIPQSGQLKLIVFSFSFHNISHGILSKVLKLWIFIYDEMTHVGVLPCFISLGD
jgi:hypothetical protein